MSINKLQKRIMRRVYYAFAVRTVTSPVLLSAALLLAGLYALTIVLHVASIMSNLRTIQVARLDNYVLNSFAHTDYVTLACVGLVFFAMLSFRFSLKGTNHFTRTAQAA